MYKAVAARRFYKSGSHTEFDESKTVWNVIQRVEGINDETTLRSGDLVRHYFLAIARLAIATRAEIFRRYMAAVRIQKTWRKWKKNSRDELAAVNKWNAEARMLHECLTCMTAAVYGPETL